MSRRTPDRTPDDFLSLDSPRIRFNWGFHDAAADVRYGRAVRDVSHHSCLAYAAGYVKGVAAAQVGEPTDSSEPAWLAHVAA